MTALVIFISIIVAIVYSTISGTTWVGPGTLTVYVWAFIAGLATAVIFALISRNRRSIIGALILVANFTGSHIAWGTSDPTTISAVLDLATAGYFVLLGQTRWELVVGFLFLGSVGLAALTFLDVLPDHTERASGFIALSYPDLTAIVGHIANAILGFGAGDSGFRIRSVFRVRPRLAIARAHLVQREG